MSQPSPSKINPSDPPKTTNRPSKDTATEARRATHDASADLKQQACKARDRTLERGKQFAEERKSMAAEECGIFGSAIRSAAESLQEDGQTSVANYAEMCADQLESTATYLREHRLSELYHDANGFARKHPEIFLGGMFLAGLAAARFLKASTPDPTSESSSVRPRSSAMPSASDLSSSDSSPDPYTMPQGMDPDRPELE